MNSKVIASAAHGYMARHWRLHIVASALTPNARAWKRLNRAAERTRLRILLAPWYRRGELPRRRVVDAWRFSDGSHVLRIVGCKYPAMMEVLAPSGASASMMRDTRAAISLVLQGSGVPLHESLACAYLDAHGIFPPLDRNTLLLALQADSSAIRLAAIASLRPDR